MTTERPKNALAKIPRRAAPQRRSRGGASRAARSQAEPNAVNDLFSVFYEEIAI
jgi:hypothetical protein